MAEEEKQMHPLKKYRIENRWKHKDMAVKLGCSVGFTCMIESGTRTGPAMAEKLAKLLKCNKDIFLYPDRYKKKYGV